ncbi:MAG: hypothetical protein H6695_18775 [Deferribacteres bacterium]|nr:hypothetical protein [Deferribacteres bacterium]
MHSQLFLLEMRSIWRTRRMRQLLILNAMMVIIFGVQFILDQAKFSLMLLAKALLIPIIAVGLTMFAFSKDGAFFPAIQTKPYNALQYVQAKYWFAAFLCFPCFLLVQAFDLLAGRVEWGLNLAFLTISIGIIVPSVIFAAAFDEKRINTSRSAFFNYEGVAWVRQQLPTLPLILPLIAPKFVAKWWIILLVLGGVSLAAYGRITARIAALLHKRKYLMLEGFRR